MKKSIWLIVTLCIALIVVAASCAPSATTTSSPQQTVKTSSPVTTAPLTANQQQLQNPKYGGYLTVVLGTTVIQFDEGQNATMTVTTGGLTHNEPAVGDWTKGPAGTGEADWTYSGNDRLRLKTGAVVQSWDIPEAGHVIFHVRQGVHYGLNPNNEASRLVNGRELTASDIAFSLQRLCTEPRAYVKLSYPRLAAGTVFTVVDKYTVDIKMPTSEFADGMSQWFDRNHIIAPEVVQKYGNVVRWDLQIGTGPFFLTDYVESSSLTFIRNPNYWEKDPIGPGKGNQLPYVNGVKLLLITDASSQQAALRTGKVDQLVFGTLDDAEAVTKSTPGLQEKRYLEHATQTIAMHLYDKSLPTSDVRVRRALFMATDLNTIKNGLYRGDAETDTWPFPDLKEYHSMHLPLSEAPADVQELYVYSPDKAKALLAEAGYPNGFKASIIVSSAPTNGVSGVDFLEAVKAMWAKVGVTLDIQVKEPAVYTSIWQGNAYPDMELAGGMGIGGYYRMIECDTPSYWNPSQVNDPTVQAAKVKIFDLFNQQKIDEVDATFKDLMKYAEAQAWYIPRPLPYSYILWWPWVKN